MRLNISWLTSCLAHIAVPSHNPFVILRKREPRFRGQRDEGPDAFQPLTTKAMRQLNVRRDS